MAALSETQGYILLAEDDENIAMLTRSVLQTPGRVIETACDGQQALERIHARPNQFNILITDHKMPRLSGLALVERLRALQFRGKIVVLSGFVSDKGALAYRALGVSKILRKPFKFDELRSAIDEVCGDSDVDSCRAREPL